MFGKLTLRMEKLSVLMALALLMVSVPCRSIPLPQEIPSDELGQKEVQEITPVVAAEESEAEDNIDLGQQLALEVFNVGPDVLPLSQTAENVALIEDADSQKPLSEPDMDSTPAQNLNDNQEEPAHQIGSGASDQNNLNDQNNKDISEGTVSEVGSEHLDQNSFTTEVRHNAPELNDEEDSQVVLENHGQNNEQGLEGDKQLEGQTVSDISKPDFNEENLHNDGPTEEEILPQKPLNNFDENALPNSQNNANVMGAIEHQIGVSANGPSKMNSDEFSSEDSFESEEDSEEGSMGGNGNKGIQTGLGGVGSMAPVNGMNGNGGNRDHGMHGHPHWHGHHGQHHGYGGYGHHHGYGGHDHPWHGAHHGHWDHGNPSNYHFGQGNMGDGYRRSDNPENNNKLNRNMDESALLNTGLNPRQGS